jgi:hypothetical protein
MYKKPEPLLPLSFHMKNHRIAKQKARNKAKALKFFAQGLMTLIVLGVVFVYLIAVHHLILGTF